MGEWQKIETAPHGRFVIIAWRRDASAEWCVGEAHQRQEDWTDGEWKWWWAGEGPHDYHASAISPQPEYWQPMPSPPRTKEKG